MKLAENLRKLRGDSSQSAFAKLFGNVAQTTYSSWERGEKDPSLEMLVKIAQTVEGGVSVDWLLGLSEVKHRPESNDANADLLIRASKAESELRRYKTAFAKIVKSNKLIAEVLDDLQEEEE